jgi:uncharacterized protein YjgD (DUF1641 family)
MSTDELILERLSRIEEKLERVVAMEAQLGTFTRSFENLHDLGRDVSLLVGPTVNLMTEELAEVETGFQLEDCFVLLKRLLLNLRNLAWSLEQLENLIDWWHDLEPLLKIAVPHLIDILDDLEQKGIFRINSAVLGMYTKIAAAYTPEDIEIMGDGFVRMHGVVKKFADPVVIQSLEAVVDMYAKLAAAYSPEDIDAMGDGFVRMHGIIKKFSDPQFIQFIEKFMEIPARVNLNETRPVGPLGLLWKMRSTETKEGLGVMVELTKALGNLKAATPEPQKAEI